jgi:two-component system response regulator NreC
MQEARSVDRAEGVSPEPIGLLLLDAHALVREALQSMLEGDPAFEVRATAATLAEALAVEEEPDLIVAELVLPDARGVEVVSQLRGRFSSARVLVLTMVDSLADVRLAMLAGARGYLLKEAAASELADAIRRVARGEKYVQPALDAAMARLSDEGAARSGMAGLSARELDVLRLIALGHTNAEAAAVLGVALRTVETHRAHILQKLGVRTRAELVRHAIAAGLMPAAPDEPRTPS